MTTPSSVVGSPLSPAVGRRLPEPRALLRLLKPITWFAPMWALA